jgi:hypothetical protein
MKKTICFVLTFAGILIIACNNPKKDTNEYPLQGAWECIHTKYVYPDSTRERTKMTNLTVKLLTKKHFAFGNQSGENKVWGGGGEYTYDGDTYTEHVKYHANSAGAAHSAKFKSTLNGDLWTISYGIKNDTLQLDITETWKRIPE